MPVFIVTDRNGQQYKMVADSLSDARVKAARRTGQPAATLAIVDAKTTGIAGSDASDSQVLSRLNLPELSTSNNTIVTENQGFGSRTTLNPNQQSLSYRGRNNQGTVTRSIAPTEQVSTNGLNNPPGLPASFQNVRFNPDGSIAWGPNEGGSPTHPGILYAQNFGGTVISDANGIVVVEMPDGSSWRFNADGTSEQLSTATGSGSTGSGTGAGGSGDGGYTGGGTGSGGGGTGYGGGTGTVGDTGGLGEVAIDPVVRDLLPDSGFRSFLRGSGVNPYGTGGFLANSQYQPARQVFTALESLGALPEGTSFMDLLQGGTLGPSRFGQLARGALGRVSPAEGTQIFDENGDLTSFTANVARLAELAARGGRSPLVADFGQGSYTGLRNVLRDRAYSGQGDITPEKFAEFAYNFMGGNRASDPYLTRLATGR